MRAIRAYKYGKGIRLESYLFKMLFLNTLLFQLVSSVFLPVSDIDKVVAVTHAHLTLPPIPGPFHGLGSSETGIKLLSPANRRPSMHVDVRPPARISGSERTFEDISHTEVLPINSDITISPTTSGIQPRIKSPKQYPKALSNATPVLEEPPLERQDSFTTKFNQDFDTQGQVGACHIFATLEVIHDATNGFKLSKEKLFLDHLFSLANKGVSHDSLKTVLNHNMKEIKRVRQLRGKNRCADSIDWEGGDAKI